MIEALYALAADPDHWTELIAVLDETEGDRAQPRALAQMAYGAEHVARIAAPPVAGHPPDRGDRVGVLVVSPAWRVLSSNAAGAETAPRLGFSTSTSGLVLTGLENQDILKDAWKRSLANSGAPAIARFVEEGAEHRTFAYVLRAERLGAGMTNDLAPWAADARAMAVLLPAATRGEAFWRGLKDSFGLTPAELTLTARLADGMTLEGAAADLGLSRFTVRNQLTSIFDKLGLRRQSDLVRSLSQLSSLFASVSPAGGAPMEEPPTEGAVFKAPPARTLALPDGRVLGFRAYGDPAGRPVLFCHGGLGASLLPPGTDALCARHGLWLLAPERPGVGRSDPLPGHSLAAVARDLAAFLDGMGVREVQICTLTSGARFGLATAAILGDRATRVLMLSPRLPPSVGEDPGRASASPMVRFQARIARNLWLVDSLVGVMRLRLTRAVMGRIMRASATSPGDARYIGDHPELIAAMVEAMGEAWVRGAQGVADEIRSLSETEGPQSPAASAPVVIWHGAEDTYASPARVAAHFNIQADRLRVVEGIGNYMMARHWTEVIEDLALAVSGSARLTPTHHVASLA